MLRLMVILLTQVITAATDSDYIIGDPVTLYANKVIVLSFSGARISPDTWIRIGWTICKPE